MLKEVEFKVEEVLSLVVLKFLRLVDISPDSVDVGSENFFQVLRILSRFEISKDEEKLFPSTSVEQSEIDFKDSCEKANITATVSAYVTAEHVYHYHVSDRNGKQTDGLLEDDALFFSFLRVRSLNIED